jgi:hypothetical protein
MFRFKHFIWITARDRFKWVAHGGYMWRLDAPPPLPPPHVKTRLLPYVYLLAPPVAMQEGW